MVNPTKYDDFVQTGVNGTHTLFKCPVAGCVNPTPHSAGTAGGPSPEVESVFQTQQIKYHSKSSNVVLPPTPTPSAPTQSMEPVATTLVINACCEESRAVRRDATELISDLPARDNPRGRLARDQCIPAWALLTGGLGKAKI